MVTHCDQPSWIGKLPPFERRGDTLISDTRKRNERKQAGDDERDVARAL